LVTTALLGAAVLVPATVTVAPAATAATTPAHIQRGLDIAQRYAAAGAMRTGIAVLNLTSGEIWQSGAARQRFASASVVKTMIATRLLVTGQMHGTVATKARSMITRSDNKAAWALYPRVGRDHLLPWIESHYHLSGIGAPPTMHGMWGSTQITARGMVRFYTAVQRDHQHDRHRIQRPVGSGDPVRRTAPALLPTGRTHRDRRSAARRARHHGRTDPTGTRA
jgi:hypothetical protein